MKRDKLIKIFCSTADSIIVLLILWLVIQSFTGGFRLNLGLFTLSLRNPSNPFILLIILVSIRIIGNITGKAKYHFPSFLRRYGTEDVALNSLFLGIFFTSASVLMLEILLTRIFSVILFYHFAFMAVSVAIFGGALSGVLVYLMPRFFSTERVRIHLGRAMIFMSASIVLLIIILLQIRIGQAYSSLNLQNLLLIYLLALLPFLFGGFGITLSFTHFAPQISRVYFSDLVGAGIGCFLIIPLLNILDAPSAVFAVAAGALIAGYFFLKTTKRKLLRIGYIAAAVILIIFSLINNQFKYLHVTYPKATKIDYSKILLERWNSFSRVEVNNLPMPDWSLSHKYTGKIPPRLSMNIDSLAATEIINFKGNLEELEYLKWDLTYVPFIFKESPRTFIIGPGGGRDIASALLGGSKEIDAAEINPIIVNEVMNGRFREYSGDIYNYPGVNVKINDARSFIQASDKKYDIIFASLVDTWAASSAGAYNLSENNLYTVEAFIDFINHLEDNGILCFERWDSESPRLLSVAQEAAPALGIQDISKNIIVVGYKRLDHFLFKKTPWEPREVAKLNEWCGPRVFWVLHDPFNYRNNKFYQLLSGNEKVRRILQRTFPNDLSPVTDDRPFFFQKEKPKSFGKIIKKGLREGTLFKGQMLFNKGVSSLQYFILVMGVMVLLLLLLPLLVFRRKVVRKKIRSKIISLAYFSAIGLGFIMIEIAMIQKFILFLGHPLYSFAVVLFSLLIFSGLGSGFTGRWKENEDGRKVRLVLVTIIALSLIYYLFLSPVFYALIKLPAILKVILSVILLMPLSFMMGMPMPLGIKYLNKNFKEIIPWAWAMNGGFSVLGSAIAVYLAIIKGYSYSQIMGISFYLLATMLTLFFIKEKQSSQKKNQHSCL